MKYLIVHWKSTQKKKLVELLRKTDFPDYMIFSCLNEAYWLNEVFDVLC